MNVNMGANIDSVHWLRLELGPRGGASCGCGWEGSPWAQDIRKSWLGHLRRVGAKLPYEGAGYGVYDLTSV